MSFVIHVQKIWPILELHSVLCPDKQRRAQNISLEIYMLHVTSQLFRDMRLITQMPKQTLQKSPHFESLHSRPISFYCRTFPTKKTRWKYWRNMITKVLLAVIFNFNNLLVNPRLSGLLRVSLRDFSHTTDSIGHGTDKLKHKTTDSLTKLHFAVTRWLHRQMAAV